MKCPVCDHENPSMLCPHCGFDASRDYEKYPTFDIVGDIPAISALRVGNDVERKAAELEKQQLLDRVAELERQMHWVVEEIHRLQGAQIPAEPVCKAPAVVKKPNILRADPVTRAIWVFRESPVFGSKLRRDQIASVTFLNTLADAPEDAWDVSADKSGSVLAWAVLNGKLYDLYFAADGEIMAPESCRELFAGYRNMHQIHFGNCFNTAKTTDMSRMFCDCEFLTKLDLSRFHTTNVSNMHEMFSRCSSLTELDLRSLHTFKVSDMYGMFYNCSSLTKLDLRSFDTSKVTNMGYMFSRCISLTKLDLSSFDTSRVTNMHCMFYLCSFLTELDLCTFDTSNVTDMGWMFSACFSLTTLKQSNRFVTARAITANIFDNCPAGK